MHVTQLTRGQRKVRKPHQCFHCYKMIAPGETANFQTNKGDYVYTLYTHPDCDALWDAYFKDSGLSPWDYDDGYPPLHDEWIESGEFENLCGVYRGQFPHAVCRLELNEQKAALRLGEMVYG